MNIKRELIALGIRLLADKTDLVRKPDSFELFMNSFLGTESYDEKLARQLDAESTRVAGAVKQKITNHKFKQITKNI